MSAISINMSNGGAITFNATSVSATQIIATVSPAAKNSTGGATVSIVGAQAPTPNVDVLGIPVITWATDPDGSSPTVSGPNATLPNPSAVVGQKILLTTTPTASDLTNLPISLSFSKDLVVNPWNVDGTNIGGYTPTAGSYATGSVTSTDLTMPNLTTYWVYSQNSPFSVAYSYCASNPALGVSDQCSDVTSSSFTVTGPNGGSMSFTPYSDSVSIADLDECTDSSGTYPGGAYLVYAQGPSGRACPGLLTVTKPGLSYDNPTGYQNASGGSFFLVQLISTDTINGTPNVVGLDTSYPNSSPIPGNDNPAVYLTSNPGTVTRTFTANVFLMWQSSTANSIPVPLGYQTWGFTGSATCNNSCGTAANWSATTIGTPGPVGGFQTSSANQTSAGNNTLVDGYPTWTLVTQ